MTISRAETGRMCSFQTRFQLVRQRKHVTCGKKYFTFEKNYVQEYGRLFLLCTFLIYGFVFAFIFLLVDFY